MAGHHEPHHDHGHTDFDAQFKYKGDIEVRLISVPEDYVPSKPGTFVKEVMNELADLGERMGADPASWSTDAP